MSAKTLVLLPGDGIGPELFEASLPILHKVAATLGHEIQRLDGAVGWAAYDIYGDVMPDETWSLCEQADAILFGAVGLPARDKELPPDMRPERRALLPLRKHFELGCNIRPVRVYPGLEDISPLKNERLAGGVNLTFFRELIGGDYFGMRKSEKDWAEDVCHYDRSQIETIARAAFRAARVTGQSVTSIDKANVLGATGTFWRSVVKTVHEADFSDVTLRHEYVDAFNLYLFTRPTDFQIVLTSNAHGDILSDGAAGLAGSMGLLPSASINTNTGFGLYEPSGGSAPDIAGMGIANPIAMILSIAMLFRYTFADNEAAVAIERAVERALTKGARTKDIARNGKTPLSTTEMAQAVLAEIEIV